MCGSNGKWTYSGGCESMIPHLIFYKTWLLLSGSLLSRPKKNGRQIKLEAKINDETQFLFRFNRVHYQVDNILVGDSVVVHYAWTKNIKMGTKP